MTVNITSISERFDNTRFADAVGSDMVKYCKGRVANLLVELDPVINMKIANALGSKCRHNCSAAPTR